MVGASLPTVASYSRIDHYLNLEYLAKKKKHQAKSLIGIDRNLD